MKKKLTRKLLLNKETVSKLQDDESRKIKGGIITDILDTCVCKTDESCSHLINCCPPPENYNIG